jgi:hypothetical protein
MSKTIFTAEWFPYYWKRFEESDSVALMSLTEEGAYHRAIRLAWKVRSLPGTAEAMAAKIQKRCTPKIAEKVLETFIPDPEKPGRVIHPVVEEIREEQKRKHFIKVRGGKASARARKQSTSNTSPTELEQNPSTTSTDLRIENKEKKKSKKEAPKTLEELILEQEANPHFAGLDIRKEADAAARWIARHPGRHFTKRFFENWLEKAEVPIHVSVNGNGNPGQLSETMDPYGRPIGTFGR